jgi:MFS family permease
MSTPASSTLQILKATFPPLLGLAIFTLGNGLLSTYVIIRMHMENFSDFTISLTSAAFFSGLALGSFQIERFILRVGHIRVYATFASIIAITSIAHSIYIESLFWIALRFIAGFSLAGLFIVVESWLLLIGFGKDRGKILAIYMVVYYLAQSLSQLLINIADPHSHILFAIPAILSCISIICIAGSKIQNHKFEMKSSLKLKELFSASYTGLIGSLGSGLLLGAAYGLMPLYIAKIYETTTAVSVMMFVIIFGGMALQYPLGKLSDIIDRQKVQIIMNFIFIATVFLMLNSINNFHMMLLWSFILGGMAFAIYPVSVSIACDNLESEDMVAGTQGMLFANAFGAMLGPIFGGFMMEFFGTQGLLYFFIVVSSAMIMFYITNTSKKRKVHHKEDEFVVIPQQTTPLVSELDPRS